MDDCFIKGPVELRLGLWQDVLADVVECDAVITDPPYSGRTHAGHGSMKRWGTTVPKSYDGANRREIDYDSIDVNDCEAFAEYWSVVASGWCAVMSDDELITAWKAAFGSRGRTVFQDVPCIIRGMAVRQAGDGPSSWAVHLNVSRPPSLSRWGTLPGAYQGPREQCSVIGGKPLWLMRAIIRDYTRPGDLIVDPFAGGATTLLAAAIEGRLAVGAERDPATFEKACQRLDAGWTTTLVLPQLPKPKQKALL